MNATDIKKAKTIRNGLITVSAGLCVIGILALFHPRTDTLAVRLVSAVACLVAAALWLLPALGKVSFSRCLDALVLANVLLMIGGGQIDGLLYQNRWDAIYEEVVRLTRSGPFDFKQFGAVLGQILRAGPMLKIGMVAIWILNILALMYLAQTEKGKEANNALQDTARKLAVK